MYKTFSNYPTWLLYAWLISNEPVFIETMDLCKYSWSNEVASIKLKQYVKDRFVNVNSPLDNRLSGFFKDALLWVLSEIHWSEVSERLRKGSLE